MNKKAEGAAARPAHEMILIVQSNEMTRDARTKKKDSLKEISSLIVEKEEELSCCE